MSLSVATTSGRRATGAVEVIPTGAALGAEVRGVDLRHLDEAGFSGLVQAWHDHSVGQSATSGSRSGPSRSVAAWVIGLRHPETGRRCRGGREIYIVSNVKVNGEPIAAR